MSLNETVTIWIEQLKTGDDDVARKLWQRYFDEMVKVARKKLQGSKRTVSDEEDVALSAFKSFCIGASEGRFANINDRESLWGMLVAITANKSIDVLRRENRQKRGGTGKAAEQGGDAVGWAQVEAIDMIMSSEPSPEVATIMSDEYQRLLDKLVDANDSQLLDIAVAKMLGESNTELATRLGCARRTIERKVGLIMGLWEEASE